MPNYKEDVQEAITFRVYNTDGTPYTTVGTPPTLFIQKNKTGTPIGVSGGTLTHHGSGLWGYIPGASEVSNPCKSVHLMWAATGVTPGDVCIDFENQFTPTVATRITDQRRPIMAYGGVVYSSASRAHSVYLTDLAGAPKTGLVFNSGISVYWRDQYGNATQVVLVTQTVTGAYATGGFVEISSANMPGWYRLDLPNALYGGGSTYAVLSINHSTITPYQCYFDIVGYQPYQANLGITDITTAKTNTDTLIARLGVFTGTGVNTVLGFLKAMTSKTATLPSDIGGTFDVTTDSSEAIRDRGDVAWGSAGGLTQGDVRTAVGLGSANLDTQLSGINAKTTN